MQADRVIASLRQMLDDYRIRARVQCGGGDDFLEESRVHAAGAGEGGEDAAVPQ